MYLQKTKSKSSWGYRDPLADNIHIYDITETKYFGPTNLNILEHLITLSKTFSKAFLS
jgi:hypothetical protein